MAAKYKNFVYDEARNFIFGYVPKVAWTNWKSLLRYMAGHDDWLDTRLAHDTVKGGLRYLDFEGPDAALLNQPPIRKYAMVREPYSRVLSAYLNKVESRLPLAPVTDAEDHFHKVVRDIDAFRRDALDTNTHPEVSFEVFLLWLRDSGSWFVNDEHWVTQTILLRQPEVSFDYIGRFENMAADSDHLLKAMGCDQGFPSQKDLNFAPTGALSKVDRYYNTSCYALVGKIYETDFSSFSYTCHDLSH